MSRAGVAEFLTRVLDDEAFRNQLRTSPDATLAQFDLTPDEMAAIKSADPAKIQELGVDERVSKAASAERYVLTDATAMSQSLITQAASLLRYVFHP